MSNKPPMSNKPMFEKPKSKLFRPDPYYIPGYCGYCPMQKYQLGETYGKTTANILTDPVIAKSGQLVLAEKKVRGENGTNRVEDLQSMRDNSWGDRKLNSSMVPGYTGYIPKSEKYFGSRYAIICDKSTNDIINRYNQCKMSKQNHEKNQLPPLIPIRREASVYISTTQAQHSNSPYFMAIDNKDKALYRVIRDLFHVLDLDTPRVTRITQETLWLNSQTIWKDWKV